MLQLFRAALLLAWIAMIWVSTRAILAPDAGSAGEVFFADFAHPWRAQFNTDFSFHLLLMALWIAARERSRIRGALFGIASVFLGGAFSFAYILAATFTTKGDVRHLLLGTRAGA